jgi:hypothetical protein
MAVTQNVMNSVVFAQTLIKNQRLNVNGQEPGLTMANLVLQRILGPPCRWRQNRANLSIPITTAGGTDYTVSLPLLGHIETQWLTNAAGMIFELGGEVSLAKTSASKRPTKVAPVYDDNAGNITFRFNAIPDAAGPYTAWFDYQQKAQLITSWANPWGVIPDECGYIYNMLFLGLAGQLVNDARFTVWIKEGVGALLGAQDGLDEQAKAIMVGQWLNETRTAARSQGSVQGGVAGRSQ